MDDEHHGRRWGTLPRGLGWARVPLPRWSRWRALQLDRSRRKRWKTWVAASEFCRLAEKRLFPSQLA